MKFVLYRNFEQGISRTMNNSVLNIKLCGPVIVFCLNVVKFSRVSCKLCITLFHFILWHSYISDTKEAVKTRTNSIVVPYRSQFEPVWSRLLHLRHKIKWSVRSSREIGSSCKNVINKLAVPVNQKTLLGKCPTFALRMFGGFRHIIFCEWYCSGGKTVSCFQEINIELCGRHIWAFHRLIKDKSWRVIKLGNKKDCISITILYEALLNESLYLYYRGTWNACKKFGMKNKCTAFIQSVG